MEAANEVTNKATKSVSKTNCHHNIRNCARREIEICVETDDQPQRERGEKGSMGGGACSLWGRTEIRIVKGTVVREGGA